LLTGRSCSSAASCSSSSRRASGTKSKHDNASKPAVATVARGTRRTGHLCRSRGRTEWYCHRVLADQLKREKGRLKAEGSADKIHIFLGTDHSTGEEADRLRIRSWRATWDLAPHVDLFGVCMGSFGVMAYNAWDKKSRHQAERRYWSRRTTRKDDDEPG
jgi:hypothetical protein